MRDASLHFEQACLPHQYGLSTRAGSEALPRVLRVAAEVDTRATVLSVDAVGAFDHVSREAFYGTPSSYVWVDAQGVTHDIAQALEEVQLQLRDGEALFAYLDDTYVVFTPERACDLVYRRALWALWAC